MGWEHTERPPLGATTEGGVYTRRRAEHNADQSGNQARVSTSGPDGVTAMVSSKWAEMLPSAVTTVQPSSSSADVVAAEVEHRLDREAHPRLDAHPGPGPPVVGDLRILVHGGADAVADEVPHDAVAVLVGDRLDRGADVAEPVAGDRGRDPRLHPPPRGVDQPA